MRPRVFPAEDEPFSLAHPLHAIRFNEAAGIPRGRLRLPIQSSATAPASMRPRVFPAEDALRLAVADRSDAASMRPRVFPAEDA